MLDGNISPGVSHLTQKIYHHHQPTVGSKISENDLHGKRSARTRKTMKLIECMKRGGERRKERRFYPKKRNDYEMGLSWKATGRGGMGEKRK